MEGVLFNKQRTELLQYPPKKPGPYLIPSGVTKIDQNAFQSSELTNVTIAVTVTNIGDGAFAACANLLTVEIPSAVQGLGNSAFTFCDSLTGIYFYGNTPIIATNAGLFDYTEATVYYLPGTTGWGSSFSGRPTAPWPLPQPRILSGPSFGVQSNQFGFRVSWATNVPVVVEACSDLGTPVWTPLTTNSLAPAGWFEFSDVAWTNYPTRLYRVRSQ